MRDTVDKFIFRAYREVQGLTDSGDQLHRRPCVGKNLVLHQHTTGKMSLRVEGQFLDRAVYLPTGGELAALPLLAARVAEKLKLYGPPIPNDAP